MHRVIEVSRLLGVSKVTVYKKMELFKKELKPYIRYRSNIAYIEDPGVELLRQSLTLSAKEDVFEGNLVCDTVKSAEELKEELKASQAAILQAYDTHSSDLLQHLENLNHMIKVRKDENERKEQHLKSLQRLVKWNKSSAVFVDKMHEMWMRIAE